MKELTLFERSLVVPSHIIEQRREKERVCREAIARWTLALKYCPDDEAALVMLLKAEEAYAKLLGR